MSAVFDVVREGGPRAIVARARFIDDLVAEHVPHRRLVPEDGEQELLLLVAEHRAAGRGGLRAGRLEGQRDVAAGLVGALSYWLSEGIESVTGSTLAGDDLTGIRGLLALADFKQQMSCGSKRGGDELFSHPGDGVPSTLVPLESRRWILSGE